MSVSEEWELLSEGGGVRSASSDDPDVDSLSEGGTAVIEALEEAAGNSLQGMLFGGILPSFYPAALLFSGHSPTAAAASEAGERFCLDLAGGSGGSSPRTAAAAAAADGAGVSRAAPAHEPAREGDQEGASDADGKHASSTDEARAANEDHHGAQHGLLLTGLMTAVTALAVLLLLLGLIAGGTSSHHHRESSYDAWGLAGPRSLRITLATGALHAPPLSSGSAAGRPAVGPLLSGSSAAPQQPWLLRVPWWLTATNSSSSGPLGMSLPMAQLPPVLQRVREGSSHATMTPTQRLRLELWLMHVARHQPAPSAPLAAPAAAPAAPPPQQQQQVRRARSIRRRCCCCCRRRMRPQQQEQSPSAGKATPQASRAAAPSCNATLERTSAWWLATAPATTHWRSLTAAGAVPGLPRNMTDLSGFWMWVLPSAGAAAAGCDSGAAQAAAWQAAMAAFAFQALPQRRARSPVCANPSTAHAWSGLHRAAATQCFARPGAHGTHGRRQPPSQPAGFVCSAMNATLLWQVQAMMQQHAPWTATAASLAAPSAAHHGWLFSCTAQEASEAYSCRRQAWHQAWPADGTQTNSSGWLWLLLAQQHGASTAATTHGRARGSSSAHHVAHSWALFNSSSSFLMLLTGGGCGGMPPRGTPAPAPAATASPPLRTVEPTQPVPALYRPPLPCLLLPGTPSAARAPAANGASSTPAAWHPFGGRSGCSRDNATARQHAAPPARSYGSPSAAMELVRRWLLQQLPAGAPDFGASWPWLPLLPASLLANSSFLGRHFTNTSAATTSGDDKGARQVGKSGLLSLPPPQLRQLPAALVQPSPLDAMCCAAPPLAAAARGVPTFALLHRPAAGADEPQGSCALWEEAFHVPASRPHRKLPAEQQQHQHQPARTGDTTSATCSSGDTASFLLVHTLPALTAGGAAAALGCGNPQASAVDAIMQQLLGLGWGQPDASASSSSFQRQHAAAAAEADTMWWHFGSRRTSTDGNAGVAHAPRRAGSLPTPAASAAHVCASNGTLALALAAAARLAAAASQVDAFLGRLNSQLAAARAVVNTASHPRCINSSSSPLAPLLAPRVAASTAAQSSGGGGSTGAGSVVPAAQWVGSFIQLPMLPAKTEPQPADGCSHGLQAAVMHMHEGGDRVPRAQTNGTAAARGKPLWMSGVM